MLIERNIFRKFVRLSYENYMENKKEYNGITSKYSLRIHIVIS